MDLINKQIGPEATLIVKEENKMLIVRFEHKGASGYEAVEVAESLEYFVGKLGDKAPLWLKTLLGAGVAALP